MCEPVWKLIHLFHLKLFLPKGNFLGVSHISSFSCLFSWSSSLSPAWLLMDFKETSCFLGPLRVGEAFPRVWSQEKLNGWNGMEIQWNWTFIISGIWMVFYNHCAGSQTGSVLMLYRQFLPGIRRSSSPLWKWRTEKLIQTCLFKHCRVELGMRIKWNFLNWDCPA